MRQRRICVPVDEVDAFLEGVDGGDVEVGAGDGEGDGGEAGACADVEDGPPRRLRRHPSGGGEF